MSLLWPKRSGATRRIASISAWKMWYLVFGRVETTSRLGHAAIGFDTWAVEGFQKWGSRRGSRFGALGACLTPQRVGAEYPARHGAVQTLVGAHCPSEAVALSCEGWLDSLNTEENLGIAALSAKRTANGGRSRSSSAPPDELRVANGAGGRPPLSAREGLVKITSSFGMSCRGVDRSRAAVLA